MVYSVEKVYMFSAVFGLLMMCFFVFGVNRMYESEVRFAGKEVYTNF